MPHTATQGTLDPQQSLSHRLSITTSNPCNTKNIIDFFNPPIPTKPPWLVRATDIRSYNAKPSNGYATHGFAAKGWQVPNRENTFMKKRETLIAPTYLGLLVIAYVLNCGD
jgi:hypothetical protein